MTTILVDILFVLILLAWLTMAAVAVCLAFTMVASLAGLVTRLRGADHRFVWSARRAPRA